MGAACDLVGWRVNLADMPKKTQQIRQKHIPERTCIACRTSSAKRQLVRVVRTVDGSVELDETSKRPGRGAYLCHSKACWDQALQKNLLDRALKTSMTAEDKARLADYAGSLKDEPVASSDGTEDAKRG